MASGYEDYVRDIEGEKAQFLKDNPTLSEGDLVVTADGITVTNEARERLAKEEAKPSLSRTEVDGNTDSDTTEATNNALKKSRSPKKRVEKAKANLQAEKDQVEEGNPNADQDIPQAPLGEEVGPVSSEPIEEAEQKEGEEGLSHR